MAFIGYDSDSGSGFLLAFDSVFTESSLVYTGDSAEFTVLSLLLDSVSAVSDISTVNFSLDSSLTNVIRDSSDLLLGTFEPQVVSLIKPFTTTIVAAADSGGPAQVWIG